MKLNKVAITLTALSLIGTFLVYPRLPDIIPTHWNASGQIDGMGSRNLVFVLGSIPLLLYILMIFLPKMDPRKENFEVHKKAYGITIIAIMLVMIALHWITIYAALGYHVDVGILVRVMIGILFIVMGNYMGQIRPNYFFGIRTPWTLSNEQVWQKTHRMGSYAFVIAGVLTAASVFIKGAAGFILMLSVMFAILIFTFGYSYHEYRKLMPKK
jgi:uncharacterized membrane protein